MVDVDFEIGQSCRFTKLLEIKNDILFASQKELEASIEKKISEFRKKLKKEDLVEFDEILKLLRNK